MDDTRRKWIEAAAILAENPQAQVPCPKCGWEYLEVSDVVYERDPTMFSRYLRCRQCGATEVIDRLRKPAAQSNAGRSGG